MQAMYANFTINAHPMAIMVAVVGWGLVQLPLMKAPMNLVNL